MFLKNPTLNDDLGDLLHALEDDLVTFGDISAHSDPGPLSLYTLLSDQISSSFSLCEVRVQVLNVPITQLHLRWCVLYFFLKVDHFLAGIFT